MAEPTIDRILQTYPNDVRVAYKHFVVHPDTARIPALATCAAQQQGKFWEMKKAVWESSWELEPRPRMKDPELLGEANMEKLARSLGLDLAKFKADLRGKACADQIDLAMRQLEQVGVDGTPAFFVNGRPILGAMPFEAFREIIEEELKKADEAIRGGVKPDELYQKQVVEKGKKSV